MKRCEICDSDKESVYEINGLMICTACLPQLKLRDLYSLIDSKRRSGAHREPATTR